jgi:flagellar motor switch protein FliM
LAKDSVLSQEEIDALLSAIHSGTTTAEEMKTEASKTKVRVYDFRHPAKFSREHIQTMHAIHEAYARLYSTSLSAQLRLITAIDVASVDQLTFEEFMRTLTAPAVVVVFSLAPLEGHALLEFHPMTAMSILDRLLGGPGRAVGKARELTDIEQSLLSRIVSRGLGSFAEAWRSVVEGMKPVVESIETNPRFVHIIPPQDTVAVVTFEMKIGDMQGAMRLCIPYPSLEPIMARMSTQLYFANAREQSEAASAQVQRTLDKVEVNMALVLGHADINVRDLLSLQVGDVIGLDTLANQDLPIMVEQDCKFYGRPGLLNNRLAAQITTVVSEEVG